MGKTQRSVGYLQSQGKESRVPASYYGFLPNNTMLTVYIGLMVWTYSRSCYVQWRYLINAWVMILYSWYIRLTPSSIVHVIIPYMMVVVEHKYVYIYMQHMHCFFLKSSTHTHTRTHIKKGHSCGVLFCPFGKSPEPLPPRKARFDVCILKLCCIHTTWRVVLHGSTGKRSFHVFPTVGLESSGFPNI